jgi:hypothetical protein
MTQEMPDRDLVTVHGFAHRGHLIERSIRLHGRLRLGIRDTKAMFRGNPAVVHQHKDCAANPSIGGRLAEPLHQMLLDRRRIAAWDRGPREPQDLGEHDSHHRQRPQQRQTHRSHDGATRSVGARSIGHHRRTLCDPAGIGTGLKSILQARLIGPWSASAGRRPLMSSTSARRPRHHTSRWRPSAGPLASDVWRSADRTTVKSRQAQGNWCSRSSQWRCFLERHRME